MNTKIIIAILVSLAIGAGAGIFIGKGSLCKSAETQVVAKTTLDIIHSRKSVRSYTDQKISREQLDTIVRAGMAAPSAVNKQPWAFIIVDDRAILDSLSATLPYAKMLENASAAIIVCGDTEKALLEPDLSYWVQDCSAATQNILLAVESMGLGAVWTGVFPRKDRVEEVRKVITLPENIIPLNVIPIGYPSKEEQPKDKYKPENIHINGW